MKIKQYQLALKVLLGEFFSQLRLLRIFFWALVLVVAYFFGVFWLVFSLVFVLNFLENFYYRRLLLINMSRRYKDIDKPSGAWRRVFDALYRDKKRSRSRRNFLNDYIRLLHYSIDNTTVGIVLLNDQAIMVWCNKQAQTMLGITLKKDAGHNLFHFLRYPLLKKLYQLDDYSTHVKIPSPVEAGRTLTAKLQRDANSTYRTLVFQEADELMALEHRADVLLSHMGEVFDEDSPLRQELRQSTHPDHSPQGMKASLQRLAKNLSRIKKVRSHERIHDEKDNWTIAPLFDALTQKHEHEASSKNLTLKMRVFDTKHRPRMHQKTFEFITNILLEHALNDASNKEKIEIFWGEVNAYHQLCCVYTPKENLVAANRRIWEGKIVEYVLQPVDGTFHLWQNAQGRIWLRCLFPARNVFDCTLSSIEDANEAANEGTNKRESNQKKSNPSMDAQEIEHRTKKPAHKV